MDVTVCEDAGPESERTGVARIELERKEVHDLVKGVTNDPRVLRFLLEYESQHDKLIESSRKTDMLSKQVRNMKASYGSSTAKARAVEDIYRNSDDNVLKLRRKVNIVYHQLIERQEQEDRTKAEIASLSQRIKETTENIKRRKRVIPQHKINLKEKLERKLDELKEEKNKTVAEVEKLKEDFWDASMTEGRLEKQRIYIEGKIEETNEDFRRVDSEISKENANKARLQAALEAAGQQLEARKQDIEDLKKKVEKINEESKKIQEQTRGITVNIERFKLELKSLNSKVKVKSMEYEEQMQIVKDLETEVNATEKEHKARENEMETMKNQVARVDRMRRMIRQRIREADSKKEKIIMKKDAQKKMNQSLIEEIHGCKKNFKMAVKIQTRLLRERDFIRKDLMRARGTMQKDHALRALHMLANKRLKQDNFLLSAQGEDQKLLMKRLEGEKSTYIKQTIAISKKTMEVADDERKALGGLLRYMRLIAVEEAKLLEMQNLYETTRNEHVIYTRHILKLREFMNRMKLKTSSMQYEAQKLIQERDFRDECIQNEVVGHAKVNRQVFVLKVNLKDIKESNTRTKLIIDNQEFEEKKMLKIIRVMNAEYTREAKGLETVVRDVDGLSLALTRRHHELQELYEQVKLKQSLLEKGENMYNIRWRELTAITDSLSHTRELRKIDSKNRKVVDQLLASVKFLQGELEKIQLRGIGLKEELSHPRNIHRWRNLRSRDPETYESIVSTRRIRRKIQEKVEQAMDTTIQIQQLDREFIGHTLVIQMQPSPETVMQLKRYKEDLNARYLLIKQLTREVKIALEEKKDGVDRQEAIRIKMKRIQTTWLKQKADEQKIAKRQHFKMSGFLALLSPNSPPAVEFGKPRKESK